MPSMEPSQSSAPYQKLHWAHQDLVNMESAQTAILSMFFISSPSEHWCRVWHLWKGIFKLEQAFLKIGKQWKRW